MLKHRISNYFLCFANSVMSVIRFSVVPAYSFSEICRKTESSGKFKSILSVKIHDALGSRGS